MKTSFKLAMASAGALMLAATGALAADIPSSGNGSLLLVVRDLSNSTRVFTSDTGLKVDDILTQAAIDAAPQTDAQLRTGVPITGIATNFADTPNAALGSFLSVASALGYEYALVGGDWVGSNARNDAWRFVGTGEIQYKTGTLSPLTGNLLGGASGLFASGGEQFFIDFNQESAVAGNSPNVTTLPLGNLPSVYGTFDPDLFAAVGTATNLYVWTSTGNGNARAAVFQALDINLLSNGTLQGGAAAVPVPAAIWLLGSGLAGMGAVSRRRKAAKAVA